MISIDISNANNEIVASNQVEKDGYLAYEGMYQPGDKVRYHFEESELPIYLWIQIDPAIRPSLMYFTETVWEYEIPFGVNRSIYAAGAFVGERHLYTVRWPYEAEIGQYRNVAINTNDGQKNFGAFPHAYANVETRNDPTFAAHNAIDGYLANHCHGSFPYQSWGINEREDAKWSLDFGHKVKINRIGITLRCDFPHDSYWIQGLVSFSDNTEQLLTFEKTDQVQYFEVDNKIIDHLNLSNLIKVEDESPFPALIEFEAFGKNS